MQKSDQATKRGHQVSPPFFPLELESHKITFLTSILRNPVIFFILIKTSFMLWYVSLSVPFCSSNESNGIDYTCAW